MRTERATRRALAAITCVAVATVSLVAGSATDRAAASSLSAAALAGWSGVVTQNTSYQFSVPDGEYGGGHTTATIVLDGIADHIDSQPGGEISWQPYTWSADYESLNGPYGCPDESLDSVVTKGSATGGAGVTDHTGMTVNLVDSGDHYSVDVSGGSDELLPATVTVCGGTSSTNFAPQGLLPTNFNLDRSVSTTDPNSVHDGDSRTEDIIGGGTRTVTWRVDLTRLGDADHDGTPDTIDKCPTTPSGAAVDEFGCFDQDGDGFPDPGQGYDRTVDSCPEQSGGPGSTNGCPPDDDDGDGVPDATDQCPATPSGAGVDARGCFDQDGDGFPDPGQGYAGTIDSCPEQSGGPGSTNGCPSETEAIKLIAHFSSGGSAELVGALTGTITDGVAVEAVTGPGEFGTTSQPSAPDAEGHRYILSSAVCSDSDSGLNVSTGVITFRVAVGESVTCDADFSVRDVYKTEVVTGFCLGALISPAPPGCIPATAPFLSQQIGIFWRTQDGAVTVTGTSVYGDQANTDPAAILAEYFGLSFSYDSTAEHVDVGANGVIHVSGEWKITADILALLGSVLPGGKLASKFIVKVLSSPQAEKKFIAWSLALAMKSNKIFDAAEKVLGVALSPASEEVVRKFLQEALVKALEEYGQHLAENIAAGVFSVTMPFAGLDTTITLDPSGVATASNSGLSLLPKSPPSVKTTKI